MKRTYYFKLMTFSPLLPNTIKAIMRSDPDAEIELVKAERVAYHGEEIYKVESEVALEEIFQRYPAVKDWEERETNPFKLASEKRREKLEGLLCNLWEAIRGGKKEPIIEAYLELEREVLKSFEGDTR